MTESDCPPLVGLIWAQNEEGIIGDGSTMPWHIPEDLAHFKQTTLGAPVIMGRRTWESLPPRFRPLPGRANIVLSRSAQDIPGATVAASLPEALQLAASLIDEPGPCDPEERAAGEPGSMVWVMGGGQIYQQAMASADLLAVTYVDKPVQLENPVYAPEIGPEWTCFDLSPWQVSALTGTRYRFTFWEKA